MKQIKVRWGDLGLARANRQVSWGRYMVEVRPGDIRLANGNPGPVFTAIHPDFFSDETPIF
jgi:hypothetical protein